MRERAQGFTLMDVLLTLALVGVLAALSIPRFNAMSARAKRVEARVGLSALWRAQKMELVRKGHYSNSFDSIGFAIEGGHRVNASMYKGDRYTYYLAQPWGPESFYVVAEGNLDRDASTDILVILEQPRP